MSAATALITNEEMDVSLRSEEQLVVVKNFPHRTLAAAGEELLRQHDITAIVQSPDLAGVGAAGGCDLYVQQKDLEKARELLEALYDGI